MSLTVGIARVVSGLVSDLVEGGDIDHILSTAITLLDMSGTEWVTPERAEIIPALGGIINSIKRGQAFCGGTESFLGCNRIEGGEVNRLFATAKTQGQQRQENKIFIYFFHIMTFEWLLIKILH